MNPDIIKILDEMKLPLVNPKEQLESISRDLFRPLFNPSKFEIRSENERDKGIDFNVEIVTTTSHTNFRFNIQLKATESIDANVDGSYSIKIHTSNINYLLNGSIPAYYVLYHKQTNQFYYESLNDFVGQLNQKDHNWAKQDSHVLRLSKKLDNVSLDNIYQQVIERCYLNRQINDKLLFAIASLNTSDKIIIDNNLNVTDDNEIRKIVEESGWHYINVGRWKEILDLHKQASGNVNSTSKYNLVLGISQYNLGQYIDALASLKAARKLKSELSPELLAHLEYFEIAIECSVGIINDEEYKARNLALEKTSTIGLYVKLNKAVDDYTESLGKDRDDKFEKFGQDIMAIIEHPQANEHIKLVAKNEFLLYLGFRTNMDFTRSVALINAYEELYGINPVARNSEAQVFVRNRSIWLKEIEQLRNAALEQQNSFVYYNVVLNESKVNYELWVYQSEVRVVQKDPNIPKLEEPNADEALGELLYNISLVYDFYKQIGHQVNICAALSLKYEIEHFLNKTEASQTIKELEEIIIANDLLKLKDKVNSLKDKGTTHEKFKEFVEVTVHKKNRERDEYKKMQQELQEMDLSDAPIPLAPTKGYHHIQLFPIGFFRFPSEKINYVLDLLNVSKEQTRNIFKTMMQEGVIPTANILYSSVDSEGPRDGVKANNGGESFRNIYRIRKGFHMNKFNSVDI